jgi:hypothetical protein
LSKFRQLAESLGTLRHSFQQLKSGTLKGLASGASTPSVGHHNFKHSHLVSCSWLRREVS